MTFREKLTTRFGPAKVDPQSLAMVRNTIRDSPNQTIGPNPLLLARARTRELLGEKGNKRVIFVVAGAAVLATAISLPIALSGNTPTSPKTHPSALHSHKRHNSVATTSTTTLPTTTTTTAAKSTSTTKPQIIVNHPTTSTHSIKVVTASSGSGSTHKPTTTTTTVASGKPPVTTTTIGTTTTTSTSTTTTTTVASVMPSNCDTTPTSVNGMTQESNLTISANQTNTGQYKYYAFAYFFASGDNVTLQISQGSFLESCATSVGPDGRAISYIYLQNPSQSFTVTAIDLTTNTYQSNAADFNGVMRK